MNEIWLFKGMMIAIVFSFIIPVNAFSQQNEAELELDGSIAEAAYSVAQNHFNLAQQELAKQNYSGAEYHWNLGGMSQDEIRNMIADASKGRLIAEDKEKLQADAANCIITGKGSVSCME